VTEETGFGTEVAHLKADLEKIVKERNIVQKQLTTRLLPIHISLLIVLQVLLLISLFAAYEWTEVNRLERLIEHPVPREVID
jgi:hypothetical protein